LKYQLQWLLNTETDFTLKIKIFSKRIKEDIDRHPVIKILQQQKNISAEQIALEKAKMLPGLQLAYNLNSFKGMGADDKVYNLHHSFILQLGVSVPVFSGGQKARIQAAKIAESVAENDIANMEFNLQNQLKKASGIYQANLDIVSQYESAELKNADVITETAKKQFLAGEINYLEFVILVNQAVTLKTIIPMQSGN
jgi:cobalt-zinc-cadmium resistance protein CzcA